MDKIIKINIVQLKHPVVLQCPYCSCLGREDRFDFKNARPFMAKCLECGQESEPLEFDYDSVKELIDQD